MELHMKYQNRYGTLVVEPVTGMMPVRDIHSRDVPEECFFSLDTAEKIVLITDNRRSQVCFTEFTAAGRGYLVVHESCSVACVVRIVSLEYSGPNAQEEIGRLRGPCLV